MLRVVTFFLFASIGCVAEAASQAVLFAPAATSPVRVGPGPGGRILLADVNRDGHVDLVTKHLESRQVVVQLGDGTGGFAAAPGSPVVREYSPGDIALGDLDGDSILDLVITRSDRDAVDVLLGDGTGAFRLSARSPFTLSESSDFFTRLVHLADINEDSRLDIITATDGRFGSERAGVLLGDGRGGFSAGSPVRLDAGGGLYSFAFGDVDGDRHLDLVTVSRAPGPGRGPGRVVTQRGDGRGTFQTVPGSQLSLPPGPRLGELADVNGDRQLDIVLSHGGSNLLSVLLNTGNGTFAPAPGSPFHVDMQAFDVLVADVNRDQRADLLAATVQNQAPPYESAVAVLLGNERGFTVAPGSPFWTGPGSYRLDLADINEDGKLDVAAASGASDGVTILLGR